MSLLPASKTLTIPSELGAWGKSAHTQLTGEDGNAESFEAIKFCRILTFWPLIAIVNWAAIGTGRYSANCFGSGNGRLRHNGT